MNPNEQLFRAIQAHANAADQFTFEPAIPRLTIVGRYEGRFNRLIEVLWITDKWVVREFSVPWSDPRSCDKAVADAFAAARKIPDGAIVATESGTLPGCEVTSELVEPSA